MNTTVILLILFGLALLNIFYPILTSNFTKLLMSVRADKEHNDALAETDRIIAELTGETTTTQYNDETTTTTTNTLEAFSVGESLLRRKNAIDANGCYEPKFEKCKTEDGVKGYSIGTVINSDCLTPGNNLTDYDAAFAQLDKYLNNMPEIEGASGDRRATCIAKPSVKKGIALFGLCNRGELLQRYCALKDQKAELADMNPGLEETDLERGLSNMELIHGVCYPDDELKCAPVETTTTTLDG
jgi:hypothetical protein